MLKVFIYSIFFIFIVTYFKSDNLLLLKRSYEIVSCKSYLWISENLHSNSCGWISYLHNNSLLTNRYLSFPSRDNNLTCLVLRQLDFKRKLKGADFIIHQFDVGGMAWFIIFHFQILIFELFIIHFGDWNAYFVHLLLFLRFMFLSQ